MNKKLLRNWIARGFAVADIGDGAWGWTKMGKESIPAMTRTNLANILYNQNLDNERVRKHAIKDVVNHGFDEEGFVAIDD